MAAPPASGPGRVRPDFTATTGLARASSRTMRVNFRGLPNDWRCRATTVVRSSAAQYWSRSLPDTSILEPTSTNVENPTPREWAWSRAARPRVPDWVRNPTLPGRTATVPKLAMSDTPGAVLITPIDSGPMTRMPVAWARSTMRSSVPSGRRSKPALKITRPPTRLRPHSSTTSSTPAAGTATTARSTASGMSSTLWNARTLATCPPAGFTGYTGPSKPPATRLRKTSWPMPPRSRPAPMTAIEVGESSRVTDAASERRSRSSMRRRPSSVGSMPRRTSMTPSSKALATWKPASWKTPSILRLVGSTVAVSPSRPFSRAATARYSSSTVARPRPWCCSSTMKATSASLWSGHMS